MSARLTAGIHRRLPFPLAFVIAATASAAWAGPAVETAFEREENRYAYTVRLQSPLAPDSLMRVLFDFDAVRALSRYTDTVFAVDVDSLSYDVVTRFSYLTLHGSASYRRKLHPAEDSISITMLHFEHNWSLLPHPVRIEAWFTAEPQQGGSRLEYRQRVEMSRRVGVVYMLVVKGELREFAAKLHELVGTKEERR
jgi:hypothetical protein